MTFDHWTELITVGIAVAGGVYAALMVILKPFINDLKRVALSMSETTRKIERLIDSQNSMHEELIASKGEHQVINKRIDNIEEDVNELKQK